MIVGRQIRFRGNAKEIQRKGKVSSRMKAKEIQGYDDVRSRGKAKEIKEEDERVSFTHQVVVGQHFLCLPAESLSSFPLNLFHLPPRSLSPSS
uniref:Uncharacterized protein n=1 Tax=Arion vulgaris TaxID=1028688 RepID=A0A0B6YTN9_9EUPU